MQHRAKKSLGQNFLKSPHYAEVLCDAARVSVGDAVLEIGPGQGILTKVILARGANLIAVEKDDSLHEQLQKTFAKEISSRQLELVHGDILDSKSYKLPAVSYKLVANIPYNITGEILRFFLGGNNQPISATLMIQKEVAERILCRDGKQSLLSISIAVFGTPHLITKVSKGNFRPQPKVDSAILHIDSISKSFFRNGDEEKEFFKLIKAGFAHKRKKVSSNISEFYPKHTVLGAFSDLSLGENERAENISKEIWLSLLRKLSKNV